MQINVIAFLANIKPAQAGGKLRQGQESLVWHIGCCHNVRYSSAATSHSSMLQHPLIGTHSASLGIAGKVLIC